MASLVLGLVGAGIGQAIGGTFLGMSAASIGWSVGSTIGTLIGGGGGSKLPTQYGPRLGDLKVQASTYGNATPRTYGTMRGAGNVIWSKPIKETVHVTKQKVSGGKGGGKKKTQKVITYTYSQTFAVALCEGPILGVRRIWANGKLIYNVGENASVETLVASNSQAASIAFYTGSETQTPNSLIQADKGVDDTPAYRGLAYVVFNDLQLADFGNRAPNLEFEIVGTGALADWVTLMASPAASGAIVSYENGLMYVGNAAGDARSYSETVYDLSGNIVVPTTTYSTTAYGNQSHTPGCRNWRGLYMATAFPAWLNPIRGFSASISNPPSWLGSLGTRVFIKVGGYVVLIMPSGGSVRMLRYPYVAGAQVPSTIHDLNLALFGYTTLDECGTYADLDALAIYYLFKLDGSTSYTLHKYDLAGTLLDYWDLTSGLTHSGLDQFKVEDGVFYIFAGGVYVRRLNADHTSTALGNYSTPQLGRCALGLPAIYWSASRIYRLGQPLSAGEVPVATIISAECARVGLAAGDIDVTGITDNVGGYSVTQRGSARAALEPLMSAFYFDAVEVDAVIKFVKRGGAVAADIPEDDMAAHVWGQAMPDAITLERTQDVELPDEVTVSYLDRDAAYTVGAQYARRLIGSSRAQQSISMAMSMSASKAKQIADVLMYDAWQGRSSFGFAVSNKHTQLVPTDVVRLTKGGRQYTARLISRDEGDGVIKFGAVWEDLQVYSQSAPAASLPTADDDVGMTVATRLELLDIPLLQDADDGDGFYAAACGYNAGWPGCQIYKSADGGATWDLFGTPMMFESPIGFATTALGDFTQNLFDELNSVTVRLQAGELASASEAEILNGANAAVLGNEIIQYRTATQLDATTYVLTGLLRGRKGTEWARATHAAGDRFVALGEATYVQPAANAEINAPRQFRGVTFGDYLDNVEDTAFTYQAVSSKPLSPVLLGGGRDAAGNITLNWTRRGRLAPEWTDYADIPLGEQSESYEVEIWTSGYTALKRTIAAATPTASYTAAQQVTDFGGNQATIYARVYQLSASVGRGYKLEGTL